MKDQFTFERKISFVKRKWGHLCKMMPLESENIQHYNRL